MWLQAVDNGFIPLEHSDEVGGLLFPDEEGAIIRAADDVLSIAGRGKGQGGQVGDCLKGAGRRWTERVRPPHSVPHTQGATLEAELSYANELPLPYRIYQSSVY